MRLPTKKYFFPIFFAVLFVFGIGCGSNRNQTDGGVFITVDGGITWYARNYVGNVKRQVVSIADLTIRKLVFDPKNPKRLYAATAEGGLYISENDGELWYKSGLANGFIIGLTVDPKNENVVYASRGRDILKSKDKGISWELIYTDANNFNIHDVEVDWYNPEVLYAAKLDGTLIKSIDGGLTWKVKYKAAKNISDIIIDPTDSRYVYIIVESFGFQKSIDAGDTWQDLYTSLKPLKPATFINKLCIDASNHDHLIIATQNGLLESMDGGLVWVPVPTLLAARTNISALLLDPDDSKIMYFSVRNLLHKTTDGGKTWTTIESFPSPRPIIELVRHPKDKNVMYAGTFRVEPPSGIFVGK